MDGLPLLLLCVACALGGAAVTYTLCMDVLEDLALQRDTYERIAHHQTLRVIMARIKQQPPGPPDYGRRLFDELSEELEMARMEDVP